MFKRKNIKHGLCSKVFKMALKLKYRPHLKLIKLMCIAFFIRFYNNQKKRLCKALSIVNIYRFEMLNYKLFINSKTLSFFSVFFNSTNLNLKSFKLFKSFTKF